MVVVGLSYGKLTDLGAPFPIKCFSICGIFMMLFVLPYFHYVSTTADVCWFCYIRSCSVLSFRDPSVSVLYVCVCGKVSVIACEYVAFVHIVKTHKS